MRILVCGGRDFGNLAGMSREDPLWEKKEEEYQFIHSTLNRLSLDWPPEDKTGNWLPEVTIITGMAKGVDSAAYDWAVINWTKILEFPADWKTHGKAAGPIRNQQMLDEGKPDLVVAFPGGNGTADMVRRAKKANIKVIEIQ